MTTQSEILLLQPGDWICFGDSSNKDIFTQWFYYDGEIAEFETRSYALDELLYLREYLPKQSFFIQALKGWHPSDKYELGEIFLNEHGEIKREILPMYQSKRQRECYHEHFIKDITKSEIGKWRVDGTHCTECFEDKELARKYAMKKIDEIDFGWFDELNLEDYFIPDKNILDAVLYKKENDDGYLYWKDKESQPMSDDTFSDIFELCSVIKKPDWVHIH